MRKHFVLAFQQPLYLSRPISANPVNRCHAGEGRPEDNVLSVRSPSCPAVISGRETEASQGVARRIVQPNVSASCARESERQPLAVGRQTWSRIWSWLRKQRLGLAWGVQPHYRIVGRSYLAAHINQCAVASEIELPAARSWPPRYILQQRHRRSSELEPREIEGHTEQDALMNKSQESARSIDRKIAWGVTAAPQRLCLTGFDRQRFEGRAIVVGNAAGSHVHDDTPTRQHLGPAMARLARLEPGQRLWRPACGRT